MESLTGFVRGLVKFLAVVFLVLAIAGTSLEFFVPKEQLRALSVQKLQERFKRQVKIGSISVGPWRGLRVDGLEISEAPDFTAGTFVAVERLTVRPKFLGLFMGRIAVGEVQLLEPKVRVVRQPGGKYNFTPLLEPEPAAQGGPPATAPAAAGAPPVVSSSGAPAGLPPLKSLDSPKRLDPVALLTTGWDDPQKKLAELGALAAAAAADAAAKLQFDVERVRVRNGSLQYQNQEGRVQLAVVGVSVWAEGLTPRSTRTDVDVGGKLTGTLQEQPTEAEFVAEAKLELDKKYYPVVSSGHLLLNKIRHPSLSTERVRAEWDLHDLTPDLTTAKGMLKLEGSPGEFNRPGYLSRQGKWPGLLLYPIEVLAKFRGLGLPDLLKLPYSELRGEYSFQGGAVNLAPVYLRGPVVAINAEGPINLAQKKVNLKASAIMGKGSVNVLIKGPMDNPSVETVSAVKAPKVRRRRAEDEEAAALLEQAFGNPDAMVPDQPGEKGGKGGKKKGAPRDLNRKHTIKDAENIIDAPLPEDD